jgi:hypothetical protein
MGRKRERLIWGKKGGRRGIKRMKRRIQAEDRKKACGKSRRIAEMRENGYQKGLFGGVWHPFC